MVTGKITVPTDAAKTVTMRAYLHYKTPDVPYTDPCCTQDGGVLQDYTVDLSGASSIQNIQSDSFVVYPNPTEGSFPLIWRMPVNICFIVLMADLFRKVL